MATHIKDLRCGSRTYYVGYSGKDVYYSTAGRGRGSTRIRKAKFINNTIVIDGKTANDAQICNAIANN